MRVHARTMLVVRQDPPSPRSLSRSPSPRLTPPFRSLRQCAFMHAMQASPSVFLATRGAPGARAGVVCIRLCAANWIRSCTKPQKTRPKLPRSRPRSRSADLSQQCKWDSARFPSGAPVPHAPHVPHSGTRSTRRRRCSTSTRRMRRSSARARPRRYTAALSTARPSPSRYFNGDSGYSQKGTRKGTSSR